MMSKPWKKTIKIHVLPNISRSKGKTWETFFFKDHVENEAGDYSQTSFCFSKMLYVR